MKFNTRDFSHLVTVLSTFQSVRVLTPSRKSRPTPECAYPHPSWAKKERFSVLFIDGLSVLKKGPWPFWLIISRTHPQYLNIMGFQTALFRHPSTREFVLSKLRKPSTHPLPFQHTFSLPVSFKTYYRSPLRVILFPDSVKSPFYKSKLLLLRSLPHVTLKNRSRARVNSNASLFLCRLVSELICRYSGNGLRRDPETRCGNTWERTARTSRHVA